jgi:sulfate adenylyltransferase subunit 1 (EFTu-like GTPase family)
MSTAHQPADLGVLRFITAGSVDDGKSTLIGRLLYDSRAVLSDQLSALSRAKNKRTVGEEIDLSLLTDGLEAEREQGITIDVAYRYFATARRKFIIADTPGHERERQRGLALGAQPERLQRQMQHDHRILAAREQQRRLAALGHELAQNVDRFRLEPVEVVHARSGDGGGVRSGGFEDSTHD